jgi:hypothetical protein
MAVILSVQSVTWTIVHLNPCVILPYLIIHVLWQVRTVETAVEREMNQYGDTLKKTADEDPCKGFFMTLATFARSFRAAADDNNAKRLAEEKAALAKAAAEARMTNAGPGEGTERRHSHSRDRSLSNSSKKENIFGMFQKSAQEATSDDVIAEFKMKMAKRAAAAAAATAMKSPGK